MPPPPAAGRVRPIESPTPGAPAQADAAATRRGRWLLACAVVGLAALATWNSAYKSLWIDEAYTEYTTRLPLVAAVRRAIGYELQPPLYFSLLDLWRRIDHSVMFGRALSTLAAVAAALVMAGVGRRAGLKRWWWLGVATACIPGVVWASAELRGYALVVLLAALSLYFYLGVTLEPEPATRSSAIGYVLSAIAGLYTFYYIGFVLAGQWVGALIDRRRPRLLTGLLAVVGCALLPMLWIIRMQVSTHPVDTVPLHVFAHPRYALFHVTNTVIGAFEGRADILALPHAMAFFVVVALAVPVLRTIAPAQGWDATEVGLTAATVTPMIALGMLRLFDAVPVHNQHMLVALPGLILIYGVWIQRTAGGWTRRVSGALVAAVILVCLLSYEIHNVQREDWRGAARYVAAHAQPGDMVVLYDPDRMLPFDDYFESRAPSIPVHGIPTDINLQRYDPFTYVIRDTAVVASRLHALGATDRSIWFVTASRLLDTLKDGPRLVQEYLGAHDHLDPVVRFVGVDVYHAVPGAPSE